ncbi:MAG TPA: 2-C-methyl-D-erythritol 2,4-cyclodiphosphate synthase [Acidobacteriota bacterium]|nr:2-C-methyl-D-erythritol 2,4-cyclodiphosphate synthase [Acidobacteriota bacterium]
MSELRIGQGFDIHRLVAGRDLVIGGIRIDFEKGLEGHSDADVLLHAIIDALLGAAGLPDIGRQFPPSDPAYRNADSAELLGTVVSLVRRAGYKAIINVDSTILAERPAMHPHVPAMKEKIARVLDVAEDRISIKATTCERLGAVGREEGIAALAVCLIARDE